MLYFSASKKADIRYWERRRIFYNLALIPSSFFGYMLCKGIMWRGSPPESHYYYLIFLLAVSALGANICYTFAYALEFFFGNEDSASRWLRFGRSTAFGISILLAMFLALIGGWNIASMDSYFQ